MSEYWVSHKRYYCKYCETYISDDKPSRQQHENGLRHKGNVERFVRGLYKASEKKVKDTEEEKREIARIEHDAAAAFAIDVSAGLVKAGSSSSSHVPTPKTLKPVPKPSDPFANYSTAKSLGYTDPDAERLKAEADARRMRGVVGDWEIVSPAPPPVTEEAVVGEKRESDFSLERSWTLNKKKKVTGLADFYDPGVIKLKAKKEEEIPVDLKVESVPEGLGERKWKPVEGGGATGDPPGTEIKAEPELDTANPKLTKEEGNGDTLTVIPKIEPDAAPPVPPQGSLFRKRKVPTGVGTSQGR